MPTTLIKNGKVDLDHRCHRPGRADRRRDHRRPRCQPGHFAAAEQGADRVIDAAGKYVIPGGIDVHTHMELPFGGTFASDTFETGSRAAAWGGVTTIVDMAVQRYGENVHEGLAEWHRKADGECADRLRLPPDHRRRRRRVAEGDGVPHRARGRHQLQAVHGLPRRVLQRRRPDPAGDAARRRLRGDDHDARRERHRHRRARAAGAGPRRDRPEVPQLHPAVAARGRGHAPGDRAQPRRRQRAALHRAHVGRRRPQRGRRSPPRGPQRVRRDLPAVPVADARGDARPSPASRAPSGCAPRRCARRTTTPTTSARWATATRATCGRACG